MDDTISREQAIDAVKRLSLGETDATRLAMRIEDYLERLPSAELGTNLAEVGTDLISRQEAIDALSAWMNDSEDNRDSAFDVLKQLPSAQPKRGRWLDANICGELPVIVCDQCNTFYPLSFGAFHNFCPNCGADMREVTT